MRHGIAALTDRCPSLGYVTHATDRPLWAFRLPTLQDDQPSVARAWLSAVADYVKRAEAGNGLPLKTVLALTESKEIQEVADEKWDEYLRMRTTLPSEV